MSEYTFVAGSNKHYKLEAVRIGATTVYDIDKITSIYCDDGLWTIYFKDGSSIITDNHVTVKLEAIKNEQSE